MTAAEVKAGILARANPRKQATIDGLWRVLEAMGKKGVRAFTLSNVAKACEAADVMHSSTLHNAGGADYRALIKAYAEDLGASTVRVVGKSASPLEEAISSIRDLDARTRLRAMIAENANYKREGERMRAAIKHMRPAIPTSAEPAPAPGELPAPVFAQIDLIPLRKFLSPDWLADNQWVVDANGAVATPAGDRVTPVGFVPALSKLIEGLSGEGL